MPQLIEAKGRVGSARRPARRRGPRPEELALMNLLRAGPRAVSEGPIGRCVKRGWCRVLIIDPPKEIEQGVCVLYALTDAGLAIVSAA